MLLKVLFLARRPHTPMRQSSSISTYQTSVSIIEGRTKNQPASLDGLALSPTVSKAATHPWTLGRLIVARLRKHALKFWILFL